MASGYTHCACRDCFNIMVSNDMERPDDCDGCQHAGCADSRSLDMLECQRLSAFGCEEGSDDDGE